MAAAPPAPESALAAPAGAPEQTLWEGRPSPMLPILRATLRTGIALAIAPGALCALQLFAFSDRNPALRDMLGWYRAADRQVPLVWVAIALAAVIVVNGLARVLRALRESWGQYYRVTTQRIVSQLGIISKDVDEIDLRVVGDDGESLAANSCAFTTGNGAVCGGIDCPVIGARLHAPPPTSTVRYSSVTDSRVGQPGYIEPE